MIALITGTLRSQDRQTLLVEPEGQSGVCFEVLVPAYLADKLLAERQGGETGVTLHTIQYLESVNQGSSFIPRLLGFASTREREFFELLTSVKGLGNKRAMRAMAVEPASIARAIADRDARFLQSLPEIGPKLAELIVHELKTKAGAFALGEVQRAALDVAAGGGKAIAEPKPRKTAGSAAKAKGSETGKTTERVVAVLPPIRQTVEALVALGESPMDAERMVTRAIERIRAAGDDVPTTTDGLLTAAYA
ncbi:MAG: hypothetical protein K2W85_02695 [Phycisphaerales bacterium]|nr:hypothetical protein [Phycisphaerales bacterium]